MKAFPSSPVDKQLFPPSPTTETQYRYDAYYRRWRPFRQGSNVPITIASDTAPYLRPDGSSLTPNDRWLMGGSEHFWTGREWVETDIGEVSGTSGQFSPASSYSGTQIISTSLPDVFQTQKAFALKTLTDEATIQWDLSGGQVAEITLAGNRSLGNPTNQIAGATYILIVRQDGTGSRTLTFSSDYKFPGGTAPTLTTTANAVDILTFVSDGSLMLSGGINADIK